jgi:rod shape determining protein RodA
MVIYHPQFLQTYFNVKSYQFGRIYAWLDPESYLEKQAPFSHKRSL